MTRLCAGPGSTYVRVAGGAAAILAAGTLAACSGSSGGGTPSTPSTVVPPTHTATQTVTATPAPPATTTSSQDGGSNGGGGAAGGSASNGSGSNGSGSNGSGSNGSGSSTEAGSYCKESQLRARIASTTNQGGDRAVIVDFRNTSNSTCVLYGYPGAAVLDSSGKQVKEAKRTVRGRTLGYAPGHNTLVHVSLKPGAVATAGIEGVDQQEQGAAQAGCDADPDPRIEVTPPNTSIPVPFTVTWPICYSFAVHPVNYQS